MDVSIISVCCLSIDTAMKVKDFLNSAESEVRSGWTEQRGTVDLHWFFSRCLIREAMVTKQGHTGLPCVLQVHHSPCFELYSLHLPKHVLRSSSPCVSHAETLLSHRERRLRDLLPHTAVLHIHRAVIHSYSAEQSLASALETQGVMVPLQRWDIVTLATLF